MIRLMIADDEKWVRMAVKALIPFEELGMALVCEAANGIEAFELCRRHEPDILLTDIMMPGLTGLELIRELRSLLPGLRIVIISGYSDFEYAKTAMKYGITDYLLKPVDENELMQVLGRIRNELEEQIRAIRTKEAEAEQYKKALPVISEVFLNQVISRNTMTAEKIQCELGKCGINLPLSKVLLCVVSPDTPLNPEDEYELYQVYRLTVKRTMRHYCGAVTFPHAKDKTVMVSIIGIEHGTERIEKAFHDCRRLLLKKAGLSVSAGISSTTRQLCMLQELYGEAFKALETRFWEGPGTMSFYKPGNLSGDLKITLPEEVLNKIILNLKLSNMQTALSYMESTCKKLQDSPHAHPDLVREFFWQFVQSVIIMLNIQLPFMRYEARLTGIQPYESVKEARFLGSLKACIEELLQQVFNFYHDKNPIDHANLIEEAKKVIESNFAGDIGLEQIAKYIHLSPAYLSELFKKETGMSFIDYKTLVRIEQAKNLLCTTAFNISDISCRVGYTDPKYFSKLFKKITGETIYEYRKGNR